MAGEETNVEFLTAPAALLALAIAAIVIGFLIAVMASRRAVTNTVELAVGTRVPRFVIGFTLLAVGTDLPEIANSIVASITGHGDLNVGDSVGSAATQATLILGLFPVVGVTVFAISRRRFARVGVATIGALAIGMALMADGFLSRADALVLFIAWIVGSVLTSGTPPPPGTQLDLQLRAADKARKAAVVLLALGVVAGGTMIALWGMTTLAEQLAVPEYMIAFFLASIGTSLPELVVDLTAVRQGQKDLAIGGVLGASFVDSTLSIAAGPLIAPVAVTSSLALRGSLVAAIAIGLVVAVLAIRRQHDWRTGIVLLGAYAGLYLFLL